MSKFRTPESVIRDIMGVKSPIEENHAPALKVPEPDRVSDALKVLHDNAIASAKKVDDNTIEIGNESMLQAMQILDNALMKGHITAKPQIVSAEQIAVPEVTPEPHPTKADPTPPENGVKLGEAKDDETALVDAAPTQPEIEARTLVNRKENQLKKIDEEAEQIDELSKSTLGSYIKKAHLDAGGKKFAAGAIAYGNTVVKHAGGTPNEHNNAIAKKNEHKTLNRQKGINKAVNKLTNEEAEQIDELSYSTVAHYANKSGKSLRSLSAARTLSADHGSPTASLDKKIAGRKAGIANATKQKQTKIMNVFKEDAALTKVLTTLTELSNKTLGRYISSASHDAAGHAVDASASYRRAGQAHTAGKSDSIVAHHDDQGDKSANKANNRHKGIKAAVQRLTKENVEQVDELSKPTLNRYRDKAIQSGREHNNMAQIHNRTGDREDGAYHENKAEKRIRGINIVQKKLGEEAEQIDELSNKTMWSYAMSAKSDTEHARGASGARINDYTGKTLSPAQRKEHNKRNKGLNYVAHKLSGVPKEGKSFGKANNTYREQVEVTEGKKDELAASSAAFAAHPRADNMHQDMMNATRHFNYVQDACDHVFSNNVKHVNYSDWAAMRPHIANHFREHGLED